MVKRSTGMVRLAGLWLGVSARVIAQTPCAELEGATPQALLEYLQGDRSSLKPACVTHAMINMSLAIDKKSFDRRAEAIKTLVGFLDYRLPDESPLQRAISLNRSPIPAYDALFIIGKPVVPSLIEAIASSVTSDIPRANAIEVVFAIYSREDLPEAVRVLKWASEAKSSTDSEAYYRLRDAARKLAGKCKGEIEYACGHAFYVDEPDSKR